MQGLPTLITPASKVYLFSRMKHGTHQSPSYYRSNDNSSSRLYYGKSLTGNGTLLLVPDNYSHLFVGILYLLLALVTSYYVVILSSMAAILLRPMLICPPHMSTTPPLFPWQIVHLGCLAGEQFSRTLMNCSTQCEGFWVQNVE